MSNSIAFRSLALNSMSANAFQISSSFSMLEACGKSIVSANRLTISDGFHCEGAGK